MNQVDKLNDKNYNIWRRKKWYVLKKQDALEGKNHIMSHPKEGNTA